MAQLLVLWALDEEVAGSIPGLTSLGNVKKWGKNSKLALV